MFKLTVTNTVTGKKYGEGRKFDTELEAQTELERLLKKTHVFTPARSIVKGEEAYPPEMVISEEVSTNEEGAAIVIVHLKENYTYELAELPVEEKKKEEANKRVKEAKKMAKNSKQAREDSMLVLDYFIGLLNARNYTKAEKRIVASNTTLRQAQGALMLGDMDLAKVLMKDLKDDELIKKSDINKLIKLINDLLV